MALLALAPAHVHANTTADSQIGGLSVEVGVQGETTTYKGLGEPLDVAVDFDKYPRSTAKHPAGSVVLSGTYRYTCPQSVSCAVSASVYKRFTKEENFTLPLATSFFTGETLFSYDKSYGGKIELQAGFCPSASSFLYLLFGMAVDSVKIKTSLSGKQSVIENPSTSKEEGYLNVSTDPVVSENTELKAKDFSEYRASFLMGLGASVLVGANTIFNLKLFAKKPVQKNIKLTMEGGDLITYSDLEFADKNLRAKEAATSSITREIETFSIGAEASVGYQFSSCAA